MTEKRAKIVCTLGPKSSDQETISKLIRAGMDVARLNFSHGTHADHLKVIEAIRAASKETGRIVGIMADLQGPKIRVARFEEGFIDLKQGQRFTLTTREVVGNEEQVSTTYKGLPQDLKSGDIVLLDDGLLSLKVIETTETDVVCEVEIGGVLSNSKGINIPTAALTMDILSPKDLADTDFALEQGLDFIALSFVRHPDDVEQLRSYLKKKDSTTPIITKIEKPQALDYLDEIIEASDAVMVARGDLGVEIPAEQVPPIQKKIISKCNATGTPVITATQMLESMIRNPRPTRAEASDVANAILDGSDAVMLSAESAAGKYPVLAVETMNRIIQAAEENQNANAGSIKNGNSGPLPVNMAIAISACAIADQVQARAIASITLSGSMARELSRSRPSQPIYALTQHEEVLRRLSLVWGVEGLLAGDLAMNNIDEALPQIERLLVNLGKLARGEQFVLTAGLPFSARKATNMVRVDTVP